MNHNNPYAPPIAPVLVADVPAAPTPPVEAQKIGGWLILIAIGIVVTPIRLLVQLVPMYSNLISDGSLALLTTPGTRAYHPLWMSILVGEITLNAVLFCAWIFMAFHFFAKKKKFPKLYISILLYSIALQVGDALAISLVRPNDPIFDPDTMKGLLQTAVTACIWIPYMLVSKRVKATFVR